MTNEKQQKKVEELVLEQAREEHFENKSGEKDDSN